MDLDTILFIVSGVLAVVGTIFGVRYAAVKKALKETKEAFVATVDAFEDDKIDSTETAIIIKEWKEAGVAWGLVFKKKE